MSYRQAPYDEQYFNDITSVRPGGYTDFSQCQKWIANRADDIQSYFGSFTKQDKVLVIGCAYGYLVDELASRDTGQHEVIGVDISSYAIGQAQSLFPTRDFQNIDFFNHSFSPNQFDLIVLERVLGSMPDKATADLFFEEVASILANDGMVYALVEANSLYYLIITDPEYQEYVDSGVLYGKSIEMTDVGHLPLQADKRVVIY